MDLINDEKTVLMGHVGYFGEAIKQYSVENPGVTFLVSVTPNRYFQLRPAEVEHVEPFMKFMKEKFDGVCTIAPAKMFA